MPSRSDRPLWTPWKRENEMDSLLVDFEVTETIPLNNNDGANFHEYRDIVLKIIRRFWKDHLVNIFVECAVDEGCQESTS